MSIPYGFFMGMDIHWVNQRTHNIQIYLGDVTIYPYIVDLKALN
jgi:hypothetical protein